ncbi:MAG: S46 family peptidase [Bacteroidetes bacterium]|nr:S46 family peptidase [Bacteroidota bacterium]
MMRKLVQKGMFLLLAASLFVGCSSTQELTPYQKAKQAELESIEAQRFDNGRMWTFDYPPMEYFKEEYKFAPDQKWMDDVRMSALRFATWCSASFVSADGLVMTNHHCGRDPVEQVSKEGENLTVVGFMAPTLDDERKVDGLFVEQLVEIRDVTDQVISAMDAASTDQERLAARDKKIGELEETLAVETGNRCQLVTFFNGGKYAAYIYKRYDDVRLVFSPELSLGFFGGDDDNFTYPRYTLDCNFFRVYGEDGKPLKTDHFFKWSANGASEGELVFTIGNPGSTSRLSTAAQLEFNRDVQFPWISNLLDNYVDVLKLYMKLHPEQKEEMTNKLFSMANSQKAYKGQLSGLENDVLMQRRKDFDKKFRARVMDKPALAAKYGQVWDEIAESSQKVRSVAPDLLALRFEVLGAPEYLNQAMSLVRLTRELNKSEEDRANAYKGNGLSVTLRALGKYKSADMDMERLTLAKKLQMMRRMLGDNDPIVQLALKGQNCVDAANRLLSETILADSAKFVAFAAGFPESINNSNDPFIAIARMAVPRREAASEVANAVRARDQVNNTLLGRALFDVYGTEIPPDATFTLRISDGVVDGYEYNGTKAPPNTTFYGMYDRHYSFPNDEQWALPERWLNPPADFNMSTPLNFVSTNDIIGGNSGSPLINRNKEIVGLAFDGNIESLPGEFIFAPEMGNRTVSLHSAAMIEAINNIYRLDRLARELRAGKIVQ